MLISMLRTINNGGTPLSLAVEGGHGGVVRLLNDQRDMRVRGSEIVTGDVAGGAEGEGGSLDHEGGAGGFSDARDLHRRFQR